MFDSACTSDCLSVGQGACSDQAGVVCCPFFSSVGNCTNTGASSTITSTTNTTSTSTTSTTSTSTTSTTSTSTVSSIDYSEWLKPNKLKFIKDK